MHVEWRDLTRVFVGWISERTIILTVEIERGSTNDV